MHRLPPWIPAAVRAVLRERVSRVYLLLVAAALVLLLADTAFFSHQDASFSRVWLMLLTLPWSPLFASLLAAVAGTSGSDVEFGWAGYAIALAAALVSAPVNALLLGVCARVLRGRTERRDGMSQSRHGDG
ncbi:hypothetical protein QMK19_24165 [Streptomyces sp. H10-C2]|uniref:SCO4225 family membrane protein n=1 Tax=unclassified Streptomyces TaxID=2593676 RepID=UPI0024BB4F8F|nr:MULTISPECIES: hypothetical protein [unclassified Streptomyces]MDJ0342900.1 hypothetical protein [Streptomyces sp. PH10-H1]MDJ0372673.1 hypothetical protein [Streptomyces sp. H10-C2]